MADDARIAFKGFHHLEFWTSNAKQASDWMCVRFGFKRVAYKDLTTGSRRIASHVIGQNDIRLVYTSPLEPVDSEETAFISKHGDAVRDVAFSVQDCEAMFQRAVSQGATPIQPPIAEDGVVVASVGFGDGELDNDCIHTFVQKPDGYPAFLPGYKLVDEKDEEDPLLDVLDANPGIGSPGLNFVDHVVTNYALNNMSRAARWYYEKLGFEKFWEVDESQIYTEYSALRSTVVSNANRSNLDSLTVRMPINEPAESGKKAKSQIQEYVDYHGGAGVQHIALNTDDILVAIASLRARGMRFLNVPAGYYDDLKQRMKAMMANLDVNVPEQRQVKEGLELVMSKTYTLEKLHILVDFDETGYLLQIFTQPVEDRPTLFYEIIERGGNQGFGEGNFKALFEAIEKEQDRRHNLVSNGDVAMQDA